MATSRNTGTTRTSSFLGSHAGRVLGALLVTVLAFTAVPFSGANAEPPVSPAQARRELARLERQVDSAVEDFNDARIELAAAQRRAATVQARVGRTQAKVGSLRKRMGGFAAAAYQSGGLDSFVTLLTTSSPQTFLDQATALDQIARDQAGQLRELKAATNALRAQQAEAAAAVEATRAVERKMASVRKTIEAQVARQQRLVEIADSRAARLARAARDAQFASRQRASRAQRVSAPAYSGPASGRAKIAVAEAYRQLGKPYQWGAEGPDRFDCSGLTMWVWAKAGVSLPHSSRMQINYGRRVSRSELAPGDLVFYGSPIHHVGIYVGSGQYIAAPHTGAFVSFRSVDRGGWAGATRL
ncbi:MAG TPA: NlpC/P60 family protein [Frankiaceae bacterium]|nr:NlpC/P60 family protein [Frankiaceae bacterium]